MYKRNWKRRRGYVQRRRGKIKGNYTEREKVELFVLEINDLEIPRN
jgi:hypothetical protein